MYIYIELEALVANAFIDLLEKQEKRKRVIFYSDLDAYGAKVIDVLNSRGDTKAVLVVSRESQRAMVEDYSDMFAAFEENGVKGIRLLDGIEPIDLWDRFCTSLSYSIIMAFRSPAVNQDLVIGLMVKYRAELY